MPANKPNHSPAQDEASGGHSAELIMQDLRFALRALRKSWGFAATAILTLALGIGANTAIFQLLDAVRLRNLPVADPARLAAVRVKNGTRGFGLTYGDNDTLSYPMWQQIHLHQDFFSGVFAWAQSNSVSLGEGAQERPARGLWVSGDTFSVLGVPPLRGRLLTAQDDQPNCGLPGVVLSYSLWQSEFAGQDAAIGSRLIIEGHPVVIIGVAPRSFFGLEVGKSFDFVLPFCSLLTYFPSAQTITRSDIFWVRVLGRLKPGQTLDQASAHLSSASPAFLEATLPGGYSSSALNIYKGFRLVAFPGGSGVSWLRQTYDSSLWLLLATTGMVLLIGCANLANLLLARASTREREMAVRLALGASRWRLIRQLLAEGLVLAAVGAALGTAIAQIFSRSLVGFLSTETDDIQLDLHLDWRVLLFTTLVAILTCVFFALVPAFRSSRAEPWLLLKSGSRGTTSGPERFSFQRLLVASQIAVSLVLLVGALLFVRSFWNLANVDPGFRTKGILITYVDFRRLDLPPRRYVSFIHDLQAAARTVPQVEAAATSTHIPLNGSTWNLGMHVNGEEGSSKFVWVSPEYFETMRIPLLAGRGFNDRDTSTSPPVAVVNEAFVRRYLAGGNATGKTIRTNAERGFPQTEYEIVGVVSNTKYSDLREPTPPMAFAPADQFPDASAWTLLFTRSSAPAAAVISGMREAIGRINPAIKMDFHVFQTDVGNNLNRERLMAVLSGFFGALAALLAVMGLYGVISYIVARKKNEIGIRMALGADRRSVITGVLRQTLTLLGVGVASGLIIALAAGKGANSLLFGLPGNDPLTLFGAAGFLVAIALVASYVPAYRASRCDPMDALRHE